MKKLPLLFLLLHALMGFAQQDTTIVYAVPGYLKDPLRSNWVKKVEKKADHFIVSFYDKKVLQEKISFANEQLDIRMGEYCFFTAGNLKVKGQYDRGYKVGEWKYYGKNNLLQATLNYQWDKYHGEFKRYGENGQLIEEGHYLEGSLSGKQLLFYENGKVAAKENYSNGKLIDGNYFDENGNPVSQAVVYKRLNYPKEMP